MKKSTTLKGIALIALLGAALSTTVMAQSSAGMGGGMGAGMGAGAGHGPTGAGGMRGMRMDKSNTPGWALMTAEERTANQAKMRAVTSYDECKTVQDEQHKVMEARAKEKGVTLMASTKNGCDMAKARGLLK